MYEWVRENKKKKNGNIYVFALSNSNQKKRAKRHQDTVGAQFNSRLNKRGQIFDTAMDSSILARVCLYYFKEAANKLKKKMLLLVFTLSKSILIYFSANG